MYNEVERVCLRL